MRLPNLPRNCEQEWRVSRAPPTSSLSLYACLTMRNSLYLLYDMCYVLMGYGMDNVIVWWVLSQELWFLRIRWDMVEGWVMEEIQNGKTLMSLLFPNNLPFIMIFSLFLTSFHPRPSWLGTFITWHREFFFFFGWGWTFWTCRQS